MKAVSSMVMPFKTTVLGDFRGGPVAKNLPCNAGDAGLILRWGTKIPPATEQLSQSTATTEREWLLPSSRALRHKEIALQWQLRSNAAK